MKIEYLIIKTKDDFCQDVEQFKSLLLSNTRLKITGDVIRFQNTDFGFVITNYEITDKKKKETVFYFQISTNESDDSIATKLEEFDALLHRINFEYGNHFTINTIWDDVSMYYTMQLYPQIIKIENSLRKIIYRFMIRIAGGNWYASSVPNEVKDSISKTLEKNNIKEESVLGNQLYYADFIQLSWFFFSKYPLKPLDQAALVKIKDAIADEKKDVNKVLEELECKSNWERYFSDILPVDNLSGKWEKLYGYRNQVAHAKRMKRKEYEEALNIINELTPAFNTCIEHIDAADRKIPSAWSKLSVGMSSVLELMGKAIAASVDREKIEANLFSSGTVLASAIESSTRDFIELANGVERIQQYRECIHDVMESLGVIAHCDAHDDYWYRTGKYMDDEIEKYVMKALKQNPQYSAFNDRQLIKDAIMFNLDDVAIESECPYCKKAYDE